MATSAIASSRELRPSVPQMASSEVAAGARRVNLQPFSFEAAVRMCCIRVVFSIILIGLCCKVRALFCLTAAYDRNFSRRILIFCISDKPDGSASDGSSRGGAIVREGAEWGGMPREVSRRGRGNGAPCGHFARKS